MNHEVTLNDSTSTKVSVSVDDHGLEMLVTKGWLLFERMGVEGDIKKAWDPTDAEAIAQAQVEFNDLLKAGFKAYRMLSDDSAGEPLTQFDPTAGRVLFVPAMQGG